MILKANLSLAVALLLAIPATRSNADEPLELDELVVTATLEPLSIRDVASSITIITREEIEQKQVKYLSDLLRDVPGFSVSQTGGPGTQTQVRVRGSEANHMLVLMDGIRANDPAAGDEFQFQYALTSDVERIEIVRGPQSATWGTDAMAGVINIIRNKGAGNQYLAGRAEAGSFNSYDVALDGAMDTGTLRLRGGVSRLETDGTNISRMGNEKDGAKNTTANAGLDFDVSDAVNLSFSGQHVDGESDFDEIDFFVTGLPTDADRTTEASQTYLRGAVRITPSDSAWSGNASVNYTDTGNQNFADGVWSSSTAAEILEVRARASVLLGGRDGQEHRLTFALDRQDIDFSQRGIPSFFGDPNQDQSYDVTGYAVEYVSKPFEGFTWTLSGRVDDFSAFDDAGTWQLAASHQLYNNLRVRGSVGTGSKAPTFTERFGFFEDLFIGNPDLRPESSSGWEFGVDTHWLEQRVNLQFAYFAQELEDEIDGFVFDPETFLFTAKNKETPSDRKGFELILDASLLDKLTLGASYTYIDATETGLDGQPVREVRRPRHMASLSVNYRLAQDRAILNLNVNYTGKQLDVFFDPATFVSEQVELASYTVVDFAASWRLNDALELIGRVSNLFDEDYEEVLGFVRPGRGVYGGLRGRFDL